MTAQLTQYLQIVKMGAETLHMVQRELNEHRLWSSSATFQKGLYHLFCLKRSSDTDAYARGLRTYQALFFLVETEYLLDFETEIPKPKYREPAPDPAGDLEHTTMRNWQGFPGDHPMAVVRRRSIDLLKRAWKARNNLIYRPHMRFENGGGSFDDCSLQDLLLDLPAASEIEDVYVQFLQAIGTWNAGGEERAGKFLGLLLSVYRDSQGRFPTVRLLRRYALILGNTQDVPVEFENYENEWTDRVMKAHSVSTEGPPGI